MLLSPNMCQTKGTIKMALKYMSSLTIVLVTSYNLTFLLAGTFSKVL